MPYIDDKVVHLANKNNMGDGIVMRRAHLLTLRNRLDDVKRADFELEDTTDRLSEDATLRVKATVEDEEKDILIACSSCRSDCINRTIITYTLPDSNTAQTLNYCGSCTDAVIKRIDEYVDGKTDALLGDSL